MNGLIKFAQESDRLQVLAAAMYVRHPLAGIAAVIAVQHGGHRIHAQSIDVKMLQPFQRTGDQEAAYLMPAQVIDQRIPVLMKSLARIAVLIQGRTIEVSQAVRIRRKMRRHPIEDDTDAFAMAGVDESREILRGTKSRAGGKLRQGLIPPRATEGVFHHG